MYYFHFFICAKIERREKAEVREFKWQSDIQEEEYREYCAIFTSTFRS